MHTLWDFIKQEGERRMDDDFFNFTEWRDEFDNRVWREEEPTPIGGLTLRKNFFEKFFSLIIK